MINVLVFGMTDNPGGVESVIMNYYRNIKNEEIHFDFLCNYHNMAYYDEVIANGSKVFFITPRRENFRRFNQELDDFMKNNAANYQVIWVNLCSLVNIDYLVLAKKYGIPKRIIHCHNSDDASGKIKRFIHLVNKLRLPLYATHYWSCSDSASSWFYNERIIGSSRYRVISNAIDVNRFVFDEKIRNTIKREMGLDDKIVIGHVGRFHFQKNHKYLIRVFSEVCKRSDSYHLLLVGQGELEEEIKSVVHAENLENKVTFIGMTFSPERLYNVMDVFVLPSEFEGLGIVALEAQANGVPCVLSSEVPKIVQINDNVNFLPLKQDVGEWCDCILKLSREDRSCNNHMSGSIFDIRYQVDEMKKALKE